MNIYISENQDQLIYGLDEDQKCRQVGGSDSRLGFDGLKVGHQKGVSRAASSSPNSSKASVKGQGLPGFSQVPLKISSKFQ